MSQPTPAIFGRFTPRSAALSAAKRVRASPIARNRVTRRAACSVSAIGRRLALPARPYDKTSSTKIASQPPLRLAPLGSCYLRASVPSTSHIVPKLWNLCHILRHDGITYHEYVTELTYLLFLKMAKETEIEDQLPKGYRWGDLTKR